jgi:hypothetical protein
MEATWTDGFFKNTIKAFKRYKLKGALIRLKNSIDNPSVFFDHLKSLSNKQKVEYKGLKKVKVKDLITKQAITKDSFYGKRLEEAKRSGQVPYSCSPIIIVDNIVHDGNHRVSICKQVGIEEVECEYYISKL